MKPIRPSLVLLLVVILVLGYALTAQQRRVARLRSALARYKSQAHGQVIARLGAGAKIAKGMDWPEGTPLSEVIEQIKSATSRPREFPNGIPIYVDLDGLRQAGRSLDSPVRQPPADDRLSLGKKLQIILEPLGLACQVKDASVVITSQGMVDESVINPNEDEP
jgi:hypothetical protein